MTPISQAIQSGYSEDEIMRYLQTMMPQMMPMVNKAVKSGYSLKNILGFISKNFETSDRAGMSETERHVANAKNETERTKLGLKMTAGLLAAPIVGIATRSALSRSLPTSLQTMSSGIGSQANLNNPASLSQTGNTSAAIPQMLQGAVPQQNVSSQIPPVNAQPAMFAQSNIPQPAQPAQAQAISINPAEVLDKLQSKTKVDELAKSGNDAASITGFFQKFYPKIVKDVEKEAGKDFENVISDYLINRPKEAEKPPEIQPEIAEEIEAPKIEKNSTVATPNGVGEVLEIRNGNAIVEVDGKKHKVSEDELISSPLGHKDLADLYDDLVGGIEKTTGQQVSRNVEWAGYDPNTNELAYKPHGSDKLYAYEDISPEDADLLTSFLTQRKSTGSNFIGAWEAGTTSPIGAAMYQLIQKLQKERGGKGNEYKNRYDTLYDALEPAKKAAKERHAERKKKAKKPRTH